VWSRADPPPRALLQAIVLFGAPGTLVSDNTITASGALTLGGVNMVDFAPWNGNYRNTRVTNNRFRADGNAFKIGIAIGPAIWGDDVTNVRPALSLLV